MKKESPLFRNLVKLMASMGFEAMPSLLTVVGHWVLVVVASHGLTCVTRQPLWTLHWMTSRRGSNQ